MVMVNCDSYIPLSCVGGAPLIQTDLKVNGVSPHNWVCSSSPHSVSQIGARGGPW